jgi:hypothetical protein
MLSYHSAHSALKYFHCRQWWENRGRFFVLLGFALAAIPTTSVNADTVMVSCTSPTVSAPAGGGTVTANVNCQINAPDAGGSYRLTGTLNNFMTPAVSPLNRGIFILNAIRQAVVTSPDDSVTNISGSASGFTASLANTSATKNIRFQYEITTNSLTPSGQYMSLLLLPSFHYRICTTPSCNKEIFTGLAPAGLTLNVVSTPVSVSCSSQPAEAKAGGGSFSINVSCTTAGGAPNQFSPSSQNIFSPTSITFFGNNNNINATLQSTVTSPDNSVSRISGSAGSGFTGTINSLPATVQVQYQGITTNQTKAGTYTSTPVSYTWSTL